MVYKYKDTGPQSRLKAAYLVTQKPKGKNLDTSKVKAGKPGFLGIQKMSMKKKKSK